MKVNILKYGFQYQLLDDRGGLLPNRAANLHYDLSACGINAEEDPASVTTTTSIGDSDRTV